jgi:hypothetical protein
MLPKFDRNKLLTKKIRKLKKKIEKIKMNL